MTKFINANSKVFFALGIIGLILVIIGYVAGGLPSIPRYDAQITAMGICLNESSFSPVASIPDDVNQFYLCGTVEGKTKRTGTLYLFAENTVVFQDGVTVMPGACFIPLVATEFDSFKPGTYYVEINYAKQTLAKTKFEVTANH